MGEGAPFSTRRMIFIWRKFWVVAGKRRDGVEKRREIFYWVTIFIRDRTLGRSSRRSLSLSSVLLPATSLPPSPPPPILFPPSSHNSQFPGFPALHKHMHTNSFLSAFPLFGTGRASETLSPLGISLMTSSFVPSLHPFPTLYFFCFTHRLLRNVPKYLNI